VASLTTVWHFVRGIIFPIFWLIYFPQLSHDNSLSYPFQSITHYLPVIRHYAIVCQHHLVSTSEENIKTGLLQLDVREFALCKWVRISFSGLHFYLNYYTPPPALFTSYVYKTYSTFTAA
jgi:hypothetical protein